MKAIRVHECGGPEVLRLEEVRGMMTRGAASGPGGVAAGVVPPR